MLADSFSKTAVLALAAMAHATPFSWGAGGFEADDFEGGDFAPGNFEHGNFEHGNFEHGNFDHGNFDHGNFNPGDFNPGDFNPGDSNPGGSNPGGSNPGDSKPGDSKPGDSKPGDSKPGDSKPGDSKPGDSNPGGSNPGESGGSDFKSQMLAAHNWYRGQHSAAALKWDDNLASKSLAWASKCSENPRHEPNQPYGENIAWGSGVSAAYGWVNLWGKERVEYNFNNPGYASGTGHFTQLVWKGTTSVGCAETKCSSGSNVVCKYDPPGNMDGANGKYFRENVGPQTTGKISDEYQG